MKKCTYTKTNWRLGLLEYLCTALSEKLSSPAELLSTHQYKGLQPTLCTRLLPQHTSPTSPIHHESINIHQGIDTSENTVRCHVQERVGSY